jgi:hypothetical protein
MPPVAFEWLARLWPFVLFAVTAALMFSDSLADPFDPALQGTARYGHNHQGALAQMLTWCACEFVALLVVLGPGFTRKIWRAVAALLVFIPITGFGVVMIMHAGGIVALHGLWLLVVFLCILVTLIVRIVRRNAP